MTVRVSHFLAAAVLAGLHAAAPGAAQAPALVAAPGPDPEWVQISEFSRGTSYVDRRSIRRENGMVRFLGRIDQAPNEHGVVRVFHVDVIDCARSTYRIIGFDAFDANDRLVLSHTNSLADAPFVAINPGSANAALHRDHCG